MAAVGCLYLGLGTKMVERCTPKICFCVVHGLLEKRDELVRHVASVQKAVKEELEFLCEVLCIRAELMDAEDIPKDQTRKDTRSMAGVWRGIDVKCHRLGIEGGLDLPSLNCQAQVHEYYFPRAIAEDPTEPARIQTVLKLRPVPLINCRVRVVKPYSKAVVDETVEI